jgi:hypothetical protein
MSSSTDGSSDGVRLSNESVSSAATSNEYEIVSINPDEADLKISGNGNEAEMQVGLIYYSRRSP